MGKGTHGIHAYKTFNRKSSPNGVTRPCKKKEISYVTFNLPHTSILIFTLLYLYFTLKMNTLMIIYNK